MGAPITDFWHLLIAVFIFVTKTLQFFLSKLRVSYINNWQKIIKFGDILYNIFKIFAFFRDKPPIYKSFTLFNKKNCIYF